MRNDVIELCVTSVGSDQNGFETETMTGMEVMAEIGSAKRSEFYQAARDGIDVRLVVTVGLDDYEAAVITDEAGKKRRPTKVIYDGMIYKVVREFRTGKTKIELTLQEVE